MKVIHMTAPRKTRRLVSGLAAGLLAAGTVLATAGVASAKATAARQTTCTPAGNYYLSSSSGGIRYYLGTPSKLSSGSAAILKPKQNSTTSWTNIACTNGNNLLENRGLALTSRATSSGANVTLKPPGNGGTGFATQQWFITCANPPACSRWDFNNVKTALWLQIRSSGPAMGQTVTTGSAPTNWTHS
jgi:hypothetical protein